jgi:hypothetical protein
MIPATNTCIHTWGLDALLKNVDYGILGNSASFWVKMLWKYVQENDRKCDERGSQCFNEAL